MITVPVMIGVGIEPHVAIATNMLALTFMSTDGSLPFMGKGVLSRSRFPVFVPLTIIGSGIGALLLVTVPVRELQIVIAIAMIAMAVFSVLNKNAGFADHQASEARTENFGGYASTFLLAVYGGFFSGGSVTLLPAAFVVLLGMTFLKAVATTSQLTCFLLEWRRSYLPGVAFWT